MEGGAVKTTKKDFDYFKQRCRYWIKRFGLTDWRMDYDHDDTPEAKATCSWRVDSRTALITLGINWTITPTNKSELNRTAFHEVCELLLAPLTVAEHGSNSATEAAHAVIYRLAHAMNVRR